jgi:hypothetical protein
MIHPVILSGLLLPLLLLMPSMPPAMEPVRVTVVVIYASSEHADSDPRLAELAREIQKREPGYTCFKLVQMLQKSIPIGESHRFALPDKQTLKVTAERPRDNDNRVCLSIEPPGFGSITYSCTCNKFLPLITPHQTADGQRLILAIMAKPCTGQGP